MQLDPIVHQRTARVAERHYGYITRIQAYEVGHTEESLRDRAGHHRLEQVNVRLFRQRGAPRTWQGDIYAATAACPPGAVAAAMSAAALFGACSAPVVPHLLVPPGITPSRIQAVYRRTRLDPLDVTTLGVIPVTRPARIPIDCARVLPRRALDEIVDRLFTSGLADRDQVLAALDRSTAHLDGDGIPDLLASMEVWKKGMTHDSVAEARMFRLIVGWGHPMPVALYEIRDVDGSFVCEVDAAWPHEKVALDYDSVEFHSPRRWPRDEQRIAAAKALGWSFVPVDKTDVAPAGQTRLRSELTALLGVGSRPSPAPRPPDAAQASLRRRRPAVVRRAGP